VEQVQKDDEGDLVRCLECGTVYRQSSGERDARACPNCGYVGWIAVSIGHGTGQQRE
jgi:DNA-directed RNA polymerase subunit RPC12/RpoP